MCLFFRQSAWGQTAQLYACVRACMRMCVCVCVRVCVCHSSQVYFDPHHGKHRS